MPTTATNRVVSELTTADLGVDHYVRSALEQSGDGRYAGRTAGTLNMRSGKIDRLRQWLTYTGQCGHLLREVRFYTDSINDLALLSVVMVRPVLSELPEPRKHHGRVR